MSNENKLFRTDALEIYQTDTIANLGKASKSGNQKLGLVNGNLYVSDSDGVVKPAVRSEIVAAGSTKTLTEKEHSGKTVALDTVTGSVVTLPPATGSGAKYRFVVTVLATSNSHIVKVGDSDDSFIGILSVLTDNTNAVIAFKPTTGDDTITLNRTTTGSTALGEWFEIEDIGANKYAVRGAIAATGTEATPFSATVS